MHNQLPDLRAIARTLQLRIPAGEQLPFARAFTTQALLAYWDRRMPGRQTPEAPKHGFGLDGVEIAEATRIGRSISRAPKPTAAYLLSTLYTLLLTDELRAELGVFFTPPPLVELLIEMVEDAGIDWSRHSMLDPAAGGGAFITPMASRVATALLGKNASPAEVIEHIARHVQGIEIDPFSGWMAQLFVEIELADLLAAAGAKLPRLVRTGDSLRADLEGHRFDLVIGNPPFGRTTLEPELRNRFAGSLYGHANLYGVFMHLAVQLCRPGGVIGLVTPTSFLGGQYFKKLRVLLREQAPPRSIHFIADRDRVFDQVLQETLLITLARDGEVQEVAANATRTTDRMDRCESVPCGRFPLPQHAQAPWILPRNSSDTALLKSIGPLPYRLRDYGFGVSTGPLVWNRHKDQLADGPGAARYPLIWAESVLPLGEFRFSAARRNHMPFVRLLAGQTHLLTSSSVVLVQRTTAKEQNRRLVAALLPAEFVSEHAGVVVENHLNMIYPLDHPARVSLRAVTALLNSSLADRIFRCINGSVAVSAYELESLPVPAPDAVVELDFILERRASQATVDRFLTAAYRQGSAEVAA
jgi:adenine-specific DNA-methyltransferase